MKILCADSLHEDAVQRLNDAGHQVWIEPDLAGDTLVQRLGSDAFEVLVVRSTQVTGAALEASSSVGLVVRAGAGTDNIDKPVASARGVYVSNVPGKNAVAVAELAMGLLLAVDRQIADGAADLRNTQWNKGIYSNADGILGKTLGLIGVGEIALQVATRARAFGMRVVAVDKQRPLAIADRIAHAGIELVADLDTLLGVADVVSLHVPRSAETDGMVNAEFLAKMNDGAVLINTARGELVHSDALLDAMNSRGIRCGFDVWPDEPSGSTAEWQSDLAAHPNVVGSHHIGASTKQAQRAIAAGTVDAIVAYAAGNVINCVNVSNEPAGRFTLIVRHFDKVGVLARVFEILRSEGMNVQQMQNQIFSGSQAAVASINLLVEPPAAVMSRLEDDADVLAISLAKSAAGAKRP